MPAAYLRAYILYICITMISTLFIRRPILGWVLAAVLLLAGGASMTRLPLAQYPAVAPPGLTIAVSYPGASPAVIEANVLAPIEQELGGVAGLIAMTSDADITGSGTINISFEPGTDMAAAQVELQNRLSRATPRLPAVVAQRGLSVAKAHSSFLLFVVLSAKADDLDAVALGDYAVRRIIPDLQRLPGVGDSTLFGSERAMRIWLDPVRLAAYNLGPADVEHAIAAQNVRLSAGAIGSQPSLTGQTVTTAVSVSGQLSTPEQFKRIVLRKGQDGGILRLEDVARVEFGAQNYSTFARLDGHPAAAIGIQLAPGANALATAELVRARLAIIQRVLPPGMTCEIPFDTSRFVRISILQVVKTLAEAVLLVFLVMYCFLRDLRYTLVPAVVVPVALIGSLGILLYCGYSINVLTLFGFVLSIGILVDDTIVVVETVERLMREEKLSPREATLQAMTRVSRAVIGIGVVLVAVFVPMACFGGAVGNIYRQFSVAMVSSLTLSTLLALTLTPALCSTLLRRPEDRVGKTRGWSHAFERAFERLEMRYTRVAGHAAKRWSRYLVAYLVAVFATAWLYQGLPTSFLPNEDQGYVLVNIQLPTGATTGRAVAVAEQVEGWLGRQPEVDHTLTITGFNFFATGQNTALAFVTLKDWSARQDPDQAAQAIARRATKALASIRDATVIALSPSPIPGLGTTTGFTFQLEDRGGAGRDRLLAARDHLLAQAAASPILSGVEANSPDDAPQVELQLDRDRAAELGVSLEDVSSMLATAMGSSYVNDFPNGGRMQRVVVQADARTRASPEGLLSLSVPSTKGVAVQLSAFTSTTAINGPVQVRRYGGYPTIEIGGEPSHGHSTGEAMAEMEHLAEQLPGEFAFEWSGASREERLSRKQEGLLLSVSGLAVYLCLVVLYGSWSLPCSALLVVPLGAAGALAGAWCRDLPNDVYFKVGLITIIGLAAKNAILIVEFAHELQVAGRPMLEAVTLACRQRFRAIMMTSLAFVMGVAPLAFATGAGSASQRAIGTGVMTGMVAATALGVVLVPAFYAATQWVLTMVNLLQRKIQRGGKARALDASRDEAG